MTFNDKEYSVDEGQPFHLFDFEKGTWLRHLTTRDKEFYVSDSVIYQPASISHGKIRKGEDVKKDSITIRLPRGDSLAGMFLNTPPESRTNVTIMRLHEGLSFSEAVIIWKGRIVSAEPNGQVLDLVCESFLTALRKQGLRYRCELICQHVLYSGECGADGPAKRVDDTIDTMDSGTVLNMTSVVDGYDDGWFSGGIVQGPEGFRRSITGHSGRQITISRPLSSLESGVEVALYPGCDRTLSTCINKFNNKNNFLGFPWLPKANPFTMDLRT